MPEVRPIDGNRLAELFESAAERGAGVLATVYRDAAHFARTAQPIEPEVRHGRWIPNGKRSAFGDLEYLCSECRRKITVNWAVIDPAEYNAFCSGCGAKMDGKDVNVATKNGGADE